MSPCLIYFFILSLTGCKSGVRRGQRGKRAPLESSEWCQEEQFPYRRPGISCKESWAAFAESCIFWVTVVVCKLHLGVKHLIVIAFSQHYGVFCQPGKEGKRREAAKREKLVSICLNNCKGLLLLLQQEMVSFLTSVLHSDVVWLCRAEQLQPSLGAQSTAAGSGSAARGCEVAVALPKCSPVQPCSAALLVGKASPAVAGLSLIAIIRLLCCL